MTERSSNNKNPDSNSLIDFNPVSNPNENLILNSNLNSNCDPNLNTDSTYRAEQIQNLNSDPNPDLTTNQNLSTAPDPILNPNSNLPSYQDAIKERPASSLTGSSAMQSRSPSPVIDMPPAYPGMERPLQSPKVTYIMTPGLSPPHVNQYNVISRNLQGTGDSFGVVMINDRMLGRNPVELTCPYCRREVTTLVEEEISETAWIACCLLFLCGCQLGCCLVPFCLPDFRIYRHLCPRCKRTIDIHRPM